MTTGLGRWCRAPSTDGMRPKRSRVVGVDFDNTLITYDELLHRVAVERGLISPSVAQSKKVIRDRLREMPGGEVEWQRLQAVAYGPRIGEAGLIGGARDFLLRCRHEAVRVYIISHKAELASQGDTRTNLREAALRWMVERGFFEPQGLALPREVVLFGATRQEKIDYIRATGCTHFIDDLEETFWEPSFPGGVDKILYAPYGADPRPTGVKAAADWQEIQDYVFC